MAIFILEGWFLSLVLPFHRNANEEELRAHRLVPLDGLRGVLALSVFFTHAASYYFFERTGLWESPPSNFYTQMSIFPVSMFFFITGYLFWSKLMRKPTFPARNFWMGRLGRLAPVYIAACICVFGLAAYVSGFHRQVPNAKLGLQLASWLAFWGGEDINGVPNSKLWLGVAWTLRFEWLFYLSLPFLGWFARRRMRTVLLVALSIGVAPIVSRLGLGGLVGGVFRLFASYCRFFAYTFSVGLLVAMLPPDRFSRMAQGKFATLLSFIAIGIALFLLPPKHGPLESAALAIPFGCICLGNTWCGLLSSRALRFLGRISYSFYLLHFLGLTIVLMTLKKYGLLDGMTPVRYWAIACGCGIATITVCAFSYQWLEYPFLHVGQNKRMEVLPPLKS
jgi:peptidoglycan/LPS O-acetylase OafA/YrhL